MDGSAQCAGAGSTAEVAAVVTAMTDGEAPFLAETLQAILQERHVGQVVVCVAVGNTWINDVVQQGGADPRIEVIAMPLMPPGAVRNEGVRHVRLPWVAFCDGDDVWCPGKVGRQLAVARRVGADIVGADHCLTDEQGRVRAVALARHLPMTSSWLVRTELMRAHPFDVTLHTAEDGEWWIRTAPFAPRARCAQVLLRYRVRAGSLSSSTPSKQRKGRIVALAGWPLVGPAVLGATWLLWWATRRERYGWCSAWGAPPATVGSR